MITIFDHFHYFPILKGKAGELEALEQADPTTWARMTPILQLLMELGDRDAADDEIRKLTGRLRLTQTPPFIVDATLSCGVDLRGRPAVEVLHEELRVPGVSPIPLTRIGIDPNFTASVAVIAATDHHGAALALPGELLTSAVTTTLLQDVLRDLNLPAGEVDLIIEMGAVDDSSVTLPAQLLTLTLAQLPFLQGWRSLVVASGAFPESLSTLATNVLHVLSRSDADLWRRLRTAAAMPRHPSFADYGVTYPLAGPPSRYRAAPNLRYTTGRNWSVLRSPMDPQLGNRTMYALARQLVTATPSIFAGPGNSWGDDEIAKRSTGSGGPGGGTQWRAWATSHHLREVTERLSTLGEP